VKQEQKRSVKVFYTREEAEGKIIKTGLYVEERPSSSVRCESYCRVASFCPQYVKIKAEQSRKGRAHPV
jgi:hypothetical protein